MKNNDDKVFIEYNSIDDYYDLYVNGLNAVASGTLYLTGDAGLLESSDAILVDGVDSGKTGMEYDFDVISENCIRVNQFQPVGAGDLDFIFVDDGNLHQLSEMYDYGYHRIRVETGLNFGKVEITLISFDDEANPPEDANLLIDGSTATGAHFAHNSDNNTVFIEFSEPKTLRSIQLYAQDEYLGRIRKAILCYKPDDLGGGWIDIPLTDSQANYNDIQYADYWKMINFGENLTVQHLKIDFETEFSAIGLNEIEVYANDLPVPVEPLDEIEYVLVEASNMFNETPPNRDPNAVIDGDETTWVKFGYNVFTRFIDLTFRHITKIGKIRVLAKSLPNVSWIGLEIFEGSLNGGAWTEVYGSGELPYDSGDVDTWYEIDVSADEWTGSKVRLNWNGFVSEMEIYEIEILPW